LEVTIDAEGTEETITAYSSPALKLNNDNAIVIRKDDYIDGRVVAILADKSASDLSKELLEKLRDRNTKVKITLEIKP